jgi:hypothetical protein
MDVQHLLLVWCLVFPRAGHYCQQFAAVNTLMSLTLCPHSVMSFFLRKQLEDSNVFTKLTGNWRGKLFADLLKANINSLCE